MITVMIRTLAMVAMMLLAAYPAVAQRYYNPEFHMGVKAGASISSMSFSPSVQQSWNQGYVAGLVFRYTEEKIFGLIGEINIEQRGWKEDFKENSQFKYSRTLTYIQIPLMTHIYFGRKVKGFVNLGPSVSCYLSSKISSNFDYKNVNEVPGFPLKNRTNEQMAMEVKNRFDYGIVGGVGMEVVIKKRHSLMLEGRYYFGIGNIFPSAKKDIFSASRAMSIQVSLAYLFKVK